MQDMRDLRASSAAVGRGARSWTQCLAGGCSSAPVHSEGSAPCSEGEVESGPGGISIAENLRPDVGGKIDRQNMRDLEERSSLKGCGDEGEGAGRDELGAGTRLRRSGGHLEAGRLAVTGDGEELGGGSSSDGDTSSQGRSLQGSELDTDSLRGGRWLRADAARFG